MLQTEASRKYAEDCASLSDLLDEMPRDEAQMDLVEVSTCPAFPNAAAATRTPPTNGHSIRAARSLLPPSPARQTFLQFPGPVALAGVVQAR